MDQVFYEVEKQSNVWVWDPHELVCPDKQCKYQKNGKFIMSDHNHITTKTARGLGEPLHEFLQKNFLLKN